MTIKLIHSVTISKSSTPDEIQSIMAIQASLYGMPTIEVDATGNLEHHDIQVTSFYEETSIGRVILMSKMPEFVKLNVHMIKSHWARIVSAKNPAACTGCRYPDWSLNLADVHIDDPQIEHQILKGMVEK